MRKFLIGAVALLGLSAVNVQSAKAGMICDYVGPAAGVAAGAVSYGVTADVAAIGGGATNVATGFLVGYPAILVSLVACDIANGGLSRNLAEVTPGAGYHSVDMERTAALKHEFNVAMGYIDDVDTVRFLASASR